MRRLLRFFLTDHGALLTVILIGLSICWLIKSGRDRQEAEARKHQIERQLGTVNPSDEVDQATAQKERLLADRCLIPGNKTEQETQPRVAPSPVAQPQRAALPRLVSFYAQVQAT